MEQSKDNFKEKLEFGQEGEKEIAEILIKKGYSIMPLYQFSDELAPQIISLNESFTSPDLMCFKNEKSIFVEVKSKTKWVEFKGVIETGCNYKHYKHYRDLSLKTKLKVYMFFNHVKGSYQGVYYTDVLTVGRYWDGTAKGVKKFKPEYFWNKDILKKI
ncbi:MAG: hypothetical protein QNK89_01635 [Lacinutrix sp.]|uniref:hypothetical protein n=1 Tax=Lacinutrix sp. TaxID=1937692 RepID=UPI0030AD4B67